MPCTIRRTRTPRRSGSAVRTLRRADPQVRSKPAKDAGYYFNARFYDAERGAFIGRDPKLQFWTPYSYVGNDPLTGLDPTGMENTVYLYNDSKRDVDLPALSSLIRKELVESGAPADLKVTQIGYFRKLFLSLDRTDALLHLKDIGVGETQTVRVGGLGGEDAAQVWVDNLYNSQKKLTGEQYRDINGFLQVLKTSVHEIGHHLFTFKDNTGGVMNQGAYQNPGIGWHYTNEQREAIKEFYEKGN